MKEKMDQDTKDLCTFQPRINEASTLAMRELRGDSADLVNERLYKSTEIIQSQRSKFIDEQLRLERQAEEQECTFKPSLSTKKKVCWQI